MFLKREATWASRAGETTTTKTVEGKTVLRALPSETEMQPPTSGDQEQAVDNACSVSQIQAAPDANNAAPTGD